MADDQSKKHLTNRGNNNNNKSSNHQNLQHRGTRRFKKSYPHWHNGVAGAVAGAGARLGTAPLDLVRIRRQLDRTVTYPRPSLWSSLRTIVRDEGGILALYRGTVAATYLWVGYSTVQFAVYGRIKAWVEEATATATPYIDYTMNHVDGADEEEEDDPHTAHKLMVAFVSGGAAGVCATLATYPFDICRTIFAARGLRSFQNTTTTTATTAAANPSSSVTIKPPKTLYEFALRLHREKGIKAFYAGSLPATIQIIPYMGLNFAIYDRLTHNDNAVGVSAYAGTISGSVSKMIVYPMDTIKKRIQEQAVFGPAMGAGADKYNGIIDCFVKMYHHEGMTSFYRGLLPSVLKTGIATGLSFALYRGTKNMLETLHDDFSYNERPRQSTMIMTTTTTNKTASSAAATTRRRNTSDSNAKETATR